MALLFSSPSIKMDFEEVIHNRRSIRHFTQEKIPKEKIIKILEAGRLAPSWANIQGVRYIVVEASDKLPSIIEAIGQKWAKHANSFIIVCIDPKDSGKSKTGLDYYMVDAAIAMEHIILAATNEGLGTCWIGWFDEDKIKNTLNIPNRIKIVAITPLGYSERKPSMQNRKKLDEIVYYDEWNSDK